MKSMKLRFYVFLTVVALVALSGCKCKAATKPWRDYTEQTGESLKKLRPIFVRGLSALEKHEKRPAEVNEQDLRLFDMIIEKNEKILKAREKKGQAK